jgi:DNA-binding response OmpR family regulator
MAGKAPLAGCDPSGDDRTGRGAILLAEADPVQRERLAAALEADGHRVVRLSTGSELVAAIYQSVYQGTEWGMADLAITEAGAPGLSGFTILRLLRDADLKIPVILLDGASVPSEVADATRQNAVVLEKPIDPLVVVRVAETFLTRDRQRMASVHNP